MWLWRREQEGGSGGPVGTVPPRKPLLPRAALSLGHLDQRLPPLTDSCRLPGFPMP